MQTASSNSSFKKILSEYAQIMLGVLIMAISIHFFFIPNDLVTGGVSGIAIIILHYSQNWAHPVPVWLSNLAINLPLLALALKVFGLKFITKTFFGAVLLTLFLYLFQFVPNPLEANMLLAAVFGGVICGVGVAIALRKQGTTGGSTLISALINKIIKHLSISRILMVVDGIIILAGLFVFGTINTMYALISIFVFSKTVEYVLEGLNFAKAAFIISSNADEIGQALAHKLDRGVTSLDGHGVYSGADKSVLLCVVAKKQIVRLKEIVSETDSNAFVIVTDVREVFGQGFKSIDDKL